VPITSQFRLTPSEHLELTMDRRCAMVDCGHRVAGGLSSQFYCLEHFVLQCYEQLELFANELGEKGKGPLNLSSIAIGSAMEIAAQAAVIGLRESELANAERSQLMDIVLWANSLIEGARGSVQRT
jgi:hypothetical protein